MEGALRLPNPLSRLPNACYLNAALQILTSMPDLVKQSASLGDEFTELARLTDIKRSSGIAEVAEPKRVLEWLNEVLTRSFAAKGRQGDAHEVLIGILTRLEESSRQAQKRVQNLVYGGFINDTICAKCKVRSRKDEPFMQLCITLPERPRALTTLQDYFTQLSAPEKLSGENKYMCSECGSLQDAAKQIYVGKYPKYLIVQVLRFSGDRGSKRRDKVAITPYWCGMKDAPPHYKLVGLVEHRGEVGGGHYVAYGIRGKHDPAWGSESAWWCFDDDTCTPVDEDHFTTARMEQNVYMMLYEFCGNV